MRVQKHNTFPDAFDFSPLRVVDGDTFDAYVHVGLRTCEQHRIRLKGVFAAELNGQTPIAAEKAKARLECLLQDRSLYLLSWGMKLDRYGRLVARLARQGKALEPADILGDLQMTEAAHKADLAYAKLHPAILQKSGAGGLDGRGLPF